MAGAFIEIVQVEWSASEGITCNQVFYKKNDDKRIANKIGVPVSRN